MSEAFKKTSGSGRYPAEARQIMYAARPAIQERTGETLNDVYFTQVLLPDFIREHADIIAGWDVVYDARGHLWEPPPGKHIGFGTPSAKPISRALQHSFPLPSQITPLL